MESGTAPFAAGSQVRRRRRRQPAATGSVDASGDAVIDLMSSDEDGDAMERDGFVEVARMSSAAHAGQWQCPQCTLLNPTSASWCEVCLYTRPGGVVAACPVHGTDVAIEDIGGEPRHAAIFATPPRRRVARIAGGVAAVAEPDPDATRAGGRGWGPDPPSPAAYLGGGALLGGIVGAASAYVRGRPVGPAAIEGAFAGGIGGAVVGEVVRVDGGNSPGGRGGGGGAAAPPNEGRAAHAGAADQSSPPAGINVQILQSYRPVRASSLGYGYRTGSLADAMLRSLAGPPGYAGQVDVDRMSYEQLLARFGDGSENRIRGATPGQIASMPTTTVKDSKSDLPQEHQSCCICLEKFASGDTRKTLPCLHGFHGECVDRWLRGNASCPVCKHAIS